MKVSNAMVDRGVRLYFDERVRRVPVPPPPRLPPPERSGAIRAWIGDALIRLAAAAIAAGMTAACVWDVPRATPIRSAIASTLREGALERSLPSPEALWASIHDSFERRGSK